MTTPWRYSGLWSGATVAVLGGGPSMNQKLADSVRQHRRICARTAVRFAPDADMLVSLDGPLDAEFWQESQSFAGMRICGFECADDALHLSLPHERVTLGEGHVVELRNNGFAAIRIAAMAGASKILLLGFDRGLYDARANNLEIGFLGMEEGTNAIIAELRAKGIEIERVDAVKTVPSGAEGWEPRKRRSK